MTTKRLLVTTPDDGSVSVLFQEDDGTHHQIAKVAFSPAESSRPSYVAVTPDQTRALVVLRGTASVAVIDTLTGGHIDTDPSTVGIQNIPLPLGATPREIVIDPNGMYAYVSDQILPRVYVITVNPHAPQSQLHKLTTLFVRDANGVDQHVDYIEFPDLFKAGFRGMAVSNSGDQLFVAAPNRSSAVGRVGEERRGRIWVVDLPVTVNDWVWKPRTDIELIGGDMPFSVTTTPDENLLLFTNFADDEEGVGFIVRDSSLQTWGVSDNYVDLKLGLITDSFDVSNARDIIVSPDGETAFVLGYTVPDPGIASRNHGFTFISEIPAGSNVGIIEFASEPGRAQLAGATRPVPLGFPFDFSLSEGGQHLAVAFGGIRVEGGFNSHVRVYDTGKLTPSLSNPADPASSFAEFGLGTRLWGVAQVDAPPRINSLDRWWAYAGDDEFKIAVNA